MRNMRKAAAVLLATGMVFALTACGGNKKVENTVNSIDDLEGKRHRCTAWNNRRYLCI